MLPSIRDVIGLRQVDGMPHKSPSLGDDQRWLRGRKKVRTITGLGGSRLGLVEIDRFGGL
jgi:hypothetical protein